MSVRPGIGWKKLAYLSYQQGMHGLDQQESFYYGKAFNYVRTQPFSFVKGLLRKTTEFTSSREMPGNIDLYLFTRWSSLLSLLTWKAGGFGFPFGLLLPLALLGLFFHWRRLPVPLLLFIVLYSASVILVHIEACYRVPVVASMCVLAGAALAGIAEMFRAKRWLNLVKVGLFIVVVAILCSLPGPFYTESPENVNYQAELHHGLGGSLRRRGRADEAVSQYRQALQVKADYAEAHYNLGTILAKKGNLNDAMSHYHKALQIEPDYVGVLFNLGLVYQLQGKPDKAIHYYKRVLKIRPDYSDALTNMGLAFHLQGKLDHAIAYYRQALQVNPEDADARKNLDVALQQKGEFD